MSQVTRTTAKTYFNTGDVPTEAQFANMLDSTNFFKDDDFTTLSGTTWDGTNKKKTLTGNLDLTLSTTKLTGLLIVTQDGTGSRTLTINSELLTINTAASSITFVSYVYDGTDIYLTVNLGAILLGVGGGPGTPTVLNAPVLSAGTPTSTTLPVTWTDTNSSPNEDEFELQYSPAGAGTWTTFSNPAANATSATITGRTASTAYDVRIRAKGDVTTTSDSAWSNTVTMTTAGAGVSFATYGWKTWHTPRLNTVTSGGFIDYIRDQKQLALGSPPTAYDLWQSTSGNRPGYVASGINGLPSGHIGSTLYVETSSGTGLLKATGFETVNIFEVKVIDLSGVKYFTLRGQQFDLALNTTGKLALGDGSTFYDTTYTVVADRKFIVKMKVTTAGVTITVTDSVIGDDVAVMTNQAISNTTLNTFRIGTSFAYTVDAWFLDQVSYDGVIPSGDWTTILGDIKTLIGI